MASRTPIYDALASLGPASVPRSLVIWDPPATPLSTMTSAFAAIATYLAVLYGGSTIMKGRQPFGSSLKFPFLVHNIALTIGSGLLLAVMLEEIIPILRHGGFFYGICHEAAWTSRLETFYIINYYFKYWELIDTVFLVLKKKPLQFLHVYHHSATALLCFSQLHGKTSVSWFVIVLNLAVHVVMYMYYAASTLRLRLPWKKAVTILQISQFFGAIGVCVFAAYSHWSSKWGLSRHGGCAGKEYAAVAGVVCLTSYLFLFLGFYAKTYKNDGKKGGKKVVANGSAANGHAKKR
ncbi:putative FEN1-fatty acid elongase [Jaminaea rosea]|uniref:Elongation of fatty acids protein n=1 Tax=Jaminaea rosea TaxID=1569628 RepID=A0A316UJS7_9BASI|nr:putative FEN1-fatty acid elongase [Jaminaea rosea]PWN25542.1 putative FEN1-fatty acid elongase [Jaminaea rosea]